MSNLLYRDDDINYLTSVDELRRIHAPFKRHNKIHTVACEMYRLWENKSLFWFLLTDEHINVELHGWQHNPHYMMLPNVIYEEFKKSIDYWEGHAKRMLLVSELPELKRITTYCATWNKSSKNIEEICKLMNLKLSTNNGDCAWMFHYWETTPNQVEEKLR